MRTPVLLLLTLCVLLQTGDCRFLESFADKVVGTFVNKTTKIKQFVEEKGRSLKHFYNDNLYKVKVLLGKQNATEAPKLNVTDEQTRVFNANRRFLDFVNDAAAKNESIYDSIQLSDQNDYKCTEDDPANHMSTPQLIALHGYAAESHTVVTEDGYILTLHRIPHGKKANPKVASRKTVLLHHGLLGSSADWILTGPEKGLSYILAEAGYDVWMANARGNTYSRAHVSKKVDSYEFWNFTWHDISQFDLPATIDYIMELKDDKDVKIDYIGHSMGTTVLFALLSTKTEYNKVLRAGYALAPVAYMSDIRSPIRIIARFANNIEYLLKLLGGYEFLPQNVVLRWLSEHACEINHYEEVICENSLFVLCGHDEKQFNRTLLPIILGHVPAGASTKTLVHYAQEIRAGGSFQQFDFGKKGNIKEYGQETPPKYNIRNVKLPMALLSADNDWLASSIDVTTLAAQLPNLIDHYVVPLNEFNHIDFLYAIDAPKLVYNKLLQLLEEQFDNSIWSVNQMMD